MRQFMLPDLGEGLEEAEIVTWYVNEGDHVVTDQPLVSVETDKAVVEVPSPWSGRIARVFGAKGDLVKVGAPLVEFAEGAEQDTGTVVGELGTGEKQAAVAEDLPSRRQRERFRCFRQCGRSRASSTSISTLCRPPDPAAPSHARTSSGPPGVSPRPVRPSHCAACGARWPSAWRRRMPRSSPPPSPTTPISTIGERARTQVSGWCARSRLPARRSPRSMPGTIPARENGVWSSASTSASRSIPRAA